MAAEEEPNLIHSIRFRTGNSWVTLNDLGDLRSVILILQLFHKFHFKSGKAVRGGKDFLLVLKNYI